MIAIRDCSKYNIQTGILDLQKGDIFLYKAFEDHSTGIVVYTGSDRKQTLTTIHTKERHNWAINGFSYVPVYRRLKDRKHIYGTIVIIDPDDYYVGSYFDPHLLDTLSFSDLIKYGTALKAVRVYMYENNVIG